MADFSFLSDNSDASDSAVDDLLSQTRDLCILEQLSALNCASFSHSDLSADLESRFARLKSLPSSSAAAAAAPIPRAAPSRRERLDSAASSPAAPPQCHPLDSTPNPRARRRSPTSARSPPSRPHPRSGAASARRERPSSAAATRKEGRISPESAGCLFWCSPKKPKPKKDMKRREVDWESDLGWSKSEELLEDLGSFSIEEQRKILRKAMAEQRKISREARKIVKMGKQASLKTGVSTPTSVSSAELSDD